MEMEALLTQQRAWFRTGATLGSTARKKALEALYQAVKDMEGDIALALERDLGKAPCESYLCETGLEIGRASCRERV